MIKFMNINRESPVPLYVQFKLNLLELIESGQIKENEKLPAEEDFVNAIGLSRFTIRQALQELEKGKHIKRIHGRGTFVTRPVIPLSVAWQFIGFSQDMKSKGFKIETDIVDKCFIENENIKSEYKNILKCNKIFFIKRLRKINNAPFLVDCIYVRHDYCPDIEKIGLKDESLTDIFSDRYKIKISHANRKLRIALADDETGRLLKVRKNSPLFSLEEIVFDKNNIAFECAETRIVSKDTEFTFMLVKGAKNILRDSINPMTAR